jgi:hypothetical protein
MRAGHPVISGEPQAGFSRPGATIWRIGNIPEAGSVVKKIIVWKAPARRPSGGARLPRPEE